MRHMTTTILLAISLCSSGQTFSEVPAGTLDLYRILGLKDSCKIEVDSFSISELVSVAQYQVFIDHFMAMSDTNYYAERYPTIVPQPSANADDAKTGITWVEASAYCQWLRKETDGGKWTHRLPKLSEWLLANGTGEFSGNTVGCWLLNAKDESAWDCGRFDYFYPASFGDPFPLRRKRVAYESLSDHRVKHGIYEDYWDFISYPNVGFRVVRVRDTR